MVSDGLYTRNRHTGACSGAFVLFSLHRRQKARCGWAEVQVKSNNYRRELLGAVGFLLVICVVLLDKKSKSFLLRNNGKPTAKSYRDYCGVIIHGNDPEKILPQDQAHLDLLCLIRTIVRELSVLVNFIHIPRHQDKDIPRHLLTRE